MSFPSGHTTYTCTILFSIWPMLNHLAKGAGVIIAISVALARIASGVHFPADVLWAALISLVVVFFSRYLIRKLTLKHRALIIKYTNNLFK